MKPSKYPTSSIMKLCLFLFTLQVISAFGQAGGQSIPPGVNGLTASTGKISVRELDLRGYINRLAYEMSSQDITCSMYAELEIHVSDIPSYFQLLPVYRKLASAFPSIPGSNIGPMECADTAIMKYMQCFMSKDMTRSIKGLLSSPANFDDPHMFSSDSVPTEKEVQEMKTYFENLVKFAEPEYKAPGTK